MESTKYIELIDGNMNLYEKKIDDSYSKVRAIKKETRGTAINNEIINLKTNELYGTKTDWENTVMDIYTKKTTFGKSLSERIWAETEKIDDNQFKVKVYEKYLNLDNVSNFTVNDIPYRGLDGTETIKIVNINDKLMTSVTITGNLELSLYDSYYKYEYDTEDSSYLDIEILKNGEIIDTVRLATMLSNSSKKVDKVFFEYNKTFKYNLEVDLTVRFVFFSGTFRRTPNSMYWSGIFNAILKSTTYNEEVTENNLTKASFIATET